MYSETDISAAVEAGVLPAAAAQALRDHVAQLRNSPQPDEENFRLLTGFNDIFVSVAAAIMLGAVWWIGLEIYRPLGALLTAGTAWGLAEYFTRQRRMALPSILLLLTFVGGIAVTVGLIIDERLSAVTTGPIDNTTAGLLCMLVASSGVVAAALHWWRFKVPITVAAGTAALAATAITGVIAMIGIEGMTEQRLLSMILIAGVAVFATAMWWDRSDTARQTRRSDVAFWLHLLAAPMIAHPLFALLGVTEGGDIAVGPALGVVALYVAFGIIALIIDRRALLVSALAYVVFAMTQLFNQFGAVEMNVALTALVIGSALLLLSAFWQNARGVLLSLTPNGLRAMVPPSRLAVAA